MADNNDRAGLSEAELAAEEGLALPDKEVVSILDLNADLDLAIDAAAPIDAAVGANVLSEGSTAQALSDQGALINQHVAADATANANQDSALDQGAAPDATTAADPTPAVDAGTSAPGDVGSTVGSAADGNLLNVNVDLNGDANIAAPINGAVAANANVAAPIDAAVGANVGSINSDAVAVSQQDAIINQTIDGSATANSDQVSDISQPDQP